MHFGVLSTVPRQAPKPYTMYKFTVRADIVVLPSMQFRICLHIQLEKYNFSNQDTFLSKLKLYIFDKGRKDSIQIMMPSKQSFRLCAFNTTYTTA